MNTSEDALAAARWAVDLEDASKRRDMFNGYHARQKPIMHDGYRADDNTEADAWLIKQWQQATNPAPVVHYTYSTPVYNGLYTSGHITAFCGATDQFTNKFQTTEALSYVTCQACLEARK